MSRWFRHYAGMMRDDKLVRVAIHSGQTIERVCWVWGAILESAAEIDNGGRYDLDAAEAAYFLRTDQADVDAIIAALISAKRVARGRVTNWSSRQFSSDRSKERVAAHRARKRSGNGADEKSNGVVTLHNGYGNAPETELETETKIEVISPNGDSSAEPTDPPLTVEEVVEAWNTTAERLGLSVVKKLTRERQQRTLARIRENTIDDFKAALTTIEQSPFLRGEGRGGWKADFDFFVQKSSFTKLVEGSYAH